MIAVARFRFAFSIAVTCAAVYACSGARDPDRPRGTGGDAAGSSTAKAGSGGGPTLDLGGAMAAPPPDLTEDAACGIGTATASLRPLNLIIMFDRSGSMTRTSSIDPVTMLDRWQTATSALISFFQAPKAAGLGVALRFFPDDYPAGSCTNAACDVVACSKVLVDMGRLTADPAPEDRQEAALIDAIATSAPPTDSKLGAGTPISAALDGALRFASEYQLGHAEEKTVVVLVTDGEAQGCDEDFRDISQLASEALATSSVATYAIGLADSMGQGVNPDHVNPLAKAGGTDHALFINDGPMASAALLDVFNTIRGMALPCDFPVPEATDNGKPIDTTLVNVTFSASNGTESTFTKVDDADHCATASSWYYDHDTAPTRIYLCPSACSLASSEPSAKLEVLVGCKTKLEKPR